MKQIIYADVLVIINIYINYGLLLLTCFCRRIKPERLRVFLASLFGGVYSLIIFVPDISDWTVSLSRIPALGIMVLLSFGYCGRKEYVKSVLSFLLINFLFAGAMFMLWFLFCPENMYYNSGIVYFDIDALTLVLLTVVAYAVIRFISLFIRNSLPDSLTYILQIYISGAEYSCRGFYDSGNCLCDPFSGEGVTIVNVDVLKDAVNREVFNDFEKGRGGMNMKLIPVKSVSGTTLLPSFRADKIKIKGIEKNITLENPVIALCREKIHGGEYGALLYSSVFDNTSKGKGDEYV